MTPGRGPFTTAGSSCGCSSHLLPYRGEMTVAMARHPGLQRNDRSTALDRKDRNRQVHRERLRRPCRPDQDGRPLLGSWPWCSSPSSTCTGRILVSVAQRLIYAIRAEIFSRIQSLSMAFFDRNRTGSIMSRVHNDVSQVDELTFIAVRSVANSLAIVGIAAAMLVMNTPLALDDSGPRRGPHSASLLVAVTGSGSPSTHPAETSPR